MASPVPTETVVTLDAGNWPAEALCTGRSHLFFPPPGERTGRRLRREALAKSYCAQCPAQEPCRQAGRLRREHGIWGGETAEERAAAGFSPRSPNRRAVVAAAVGSRAG